MVPEVVVAPVALHIPYVQDKLRKDFKVAAQNAWVKGSGAYTGEIRCELPDPLFPCSMVRSFTQGGLCPT